MHEQQTSIGRTHELTMIEEMIRDPEGARHVLPLIGAAGIGKTWLLRTLYHRYRDDPGILVVRIDYGESRPQSLPGLSLHVIEQFGAYMHDQQKATYHKHMADWEKLLETELDPERIREEQNKIYHFGIDLIWQMSQQRRTLVLCDGIDRESAAEDIKKTNMLATNLPNTVIILSGRPTPFTHAIYQECSELYKRWTYHEPYQLGAFLEDETKSYLTQIVSPDLPAQTQTSIALLTKGHPVLTAIAGTWLTNHPLPDDLLLTPEQAQDAATFAEKQQQFERLLVEDIHAQQRPLDRALLSLAYLDRRYDPRIIKRILGMEQEDDLAALITELQAHMFTRSFLLTDGGLLHEEARRLLIEHVWQELDPDGSQRLALVQQVINEFYLPEIEHLDSIVQNKLARSLQPTLTTAEHRDKLPIPDEYWPKRDLQMECLYYQFCISETAGWSYLNQLFDDALTYHYSLIQLDAIVNAVYKLAPQQVNSAKFQVRFAQILFEKGEVKRAAQVAEKAMESSDIEPEDAAKAFIVLADSTTDPAEKVTHFKVAHEMAEAAEDPVLELKVLNRLGLAYRRQGHWSEAEAAYLQVLRLLNPEQEPNQYAATLNNLSFVYMLNGNPTRADNLAEKALRMRREQGNIHGLGFSYSTRGRISEAMGDYVLALRYHRTAVDLCELVGDTNNAALMQVNVAACECHGQKFETAHLLLSRALRSDLPHIRARALQQAARIDIEEAKSLTSQGAPPNEIETLYASAQKAALQALELAREVLDDHLIASTLIDILFIAHLKDHQRDEESWLALETILKDHQYKLEKGRLIELEGHFAFSQGDIPTAFQHYLEACNVLASYSIASFRHVFEQVRDKFLDVPPDTQKQLCQMIQEHYADISSDSPLIALKELCIGEIIGF